ncbi:lipid asymmetry maintenance protein MlaB [Methylotuvimicrobium buryatense]|uniref:STAS domain-containing protein n=1 Tax=Methylotuvimicrobium buryatense TaxID=95641 RepID=A0A4P9UMQ8_METBY|nr:STAS domain-containing protein [Methylotuvimicrobium buryatense]QCW82622.1 STAS domain-containing protein [Methylotuvimicrobium buryatense]
MNIRFDYDPENNRLSLDGEMTIYTAAELKGRLMQRLHESETLAIDLSRVGEIDSSGVQLLLLMFRDAATKNKCIRIVASSPAFDEVVFLCSLQEAFGMNGIEAEEEA